MMTYGNEEVEKIWANHFNGIWQSSHGPVQDQNFGKTKLPKITFG